MLIIRTKKELEDAVKNKVANFTVEGELAEKLSKAKKITTLSKITLGILTAGITLAPTTGGLSALAGGFGIASAAISGLEIAAILAVIFLGIGFIMMIYKDYEIEFEYHNNEATKAKFKRK